MSKGPFSLKDFSSVYLGNVSIGQDLSHAPDFLKKSLVSAGFASYPKNEEKSTGAKNVSNESTYQTKVVKETPDFLAPGVEQPEQKSSSSLQAAQVLQNQTLSESENGGTKKASKKKGK